MKTSLALTVILLLGVPTVSLAQEADNSLPRITERRFLEDLDRFEAARTDPEDALGNVRWVLRSRHFVFGMPRLLDELTSLNQEPAKPILTCQKSTGGCARLSWIFGAPWPDVPS